MSANELRSIRDGLQYVAYQSKNPILVENALKKLATLKSKGPELDEAHETMHPYMITDQLNQSLSNSKIYLMTAVYGITILMIVIYVSAIAESISAMR